MDVLAVSTRSRLDFLAERGIQASYIPLGYDVSYGSDLGRERDTDVLFLGESRIPRRRRILDELRRSGLNITVLGDWSDPNLWGDRRTALLNRAKVFLNVLRFPSEFSGLRFMLGAANGALIISEPVYDSFPFVPGDHYIRATLQEMPALVRHFLNHEDDRQRIVKQAYTLVTQDLTMERSVAKLVESFAPHR